MRLLKHLCPKGKRGFARAPKPCTIGRCQKGHGVTSRTGLGSFVPPLRGAGFCSPKARIGVRELPRHTALGRGTPHRVQERSPPTARQRPAVARRRRTTACGGTARISRSRGAPGTPEGAGSQPAPEPSLRARAAFGPLGDDGSETWTRGLFENSKGALQGQRLKP